MKMKNNVIEYNNIYYIITEKNNMKINKLMVKIIRVWNYYSHKRNVNIFLLLFIYNIDINIIVFIIYII